MVPCFSGSSTVLSFDLAAVGVKGRTITLKIMRRKANAPEPPKFMGHGSCDNFTRSKTLARYTDAPADLAREGKDMLLAMRLDATQIRGIGLNVSCRWQGRTGSPIDRSLSQGRHQAGLKSSLDVTQAVAALSWRQSQQSRSALMDPANVP